ncbi:FAST kinase domain-containing protein 4 [Camarhynchus parvulus]|uniref:FAST kinase domain-containing protein 4 n=1 Tax=Geospiza parvula TaxID=87175 RepID=UPI0012382E33|nr:FAST kinase domain-containing protein 4 [Camarhynchus parvulus]
MAAHLVRRCCRRLLLLPGPGAGPALRTGPARAAEEPRARPEGEEQQLRELIRAAGSAQELLQLGRDSALSSNLAALAIGRLARLSAEQRLDTESLRGDPRFQRLLGTLDAQISQVWNSSLLQLLRVLPALGLPRGGRQVRSVEQEVLWRLRRLPLRQLVQLAEQLAGQGPPGPLLPEVLRKLELRWTELEGTRTVVTLMAKVGHLSPALMERLEDKALELAEQFDPVSPVLSPRPWSWQSSLTPTSCPWLRALSYHLLQKPAELPLPPAVPPGTGKLSFQQPQVLHRLALELQPHLGSLSPAQVLRCARSFASLRWLSRPLAEAMAQYCLDNTQDLSSTQPHIPIFPFFPFFPQYCLDNTQDLSITQPHIPIFPFFPFFPQYCLDNTQDLSSTQLCGILVSFARLNFQPSSSEEFFSMIHERLQGQEPQLDVHLLTDVVWSLCVLQQPRAPHLRQLLSPEFQARLRGDSSPRAESSWLKLLHINATARLEVPGYEGPFLPPELLGGHGDRDKDKEKATPLQRWLREALPGALGGPDLVRYNVSTVYGWDIDAEAVLDSDNKPLPVREYAAPHLSHSEGTKPLPPGARRVAVLSVCPCPCAQGGRLSAVLSVQGAHAQCVCCARVAVLAAATVQLTPGAAGPGLSRPGTSEPALLLAEVPHYEFLELKLERQRVAYLKDKVAKALASDAAEDTAGDTAT